MAYRQNHDSYNTGQQQIHSPYRQQPQQNDYAIYAPPPPVGNTGVTADYSPQLHNYPSEDPHTNWDAKSTKSYQSSYTGSQAHLNPYEMSQVPPPVPQMQYQGYAQGPHPIQQPQQYPPRPGMYRDGSSSAGWSVVREKLMKRRSVKQVQLFRGNLVLDVPVPSHITPAGKGDIEEFSKMRYTAATCDPDDFMSSRYSLRQYLSGRDTELFIVMTMYNEDEVLFVKTMNACVIFHFNKCRNSLALPRKVSLRILVIFVVVHVQRRGGLKDGKGLLYALFLTDGVKSISAHFKSLVLYATIRTLLSIRLFDYHLDGMLPRRHCKRFSRWEGCHRPYIRVRLLFSMLLSRR